MLEIDWQVWHKRAWVRKQFVPGNIYMFTYSMYVHTYIPTWCPASEKEAKTQCYCGNSKIVFLFYLGGGGMLLVDWSLLTARVARWYIFIPKNVNFDNFGMAIKAENVGILYGHLVYFINSWCRYFGDDLEYLRPQGIFSQFWYAEPRKNLATLLTAME
jgi:hypothetical protein